MSEVRIYLPMAMRVDADGRSNVEISAQTLEESLFKLTERYAGLHRRLFSGEQKLHPFVKIFINQEEVNFNSSSKVKFEGDVEIEIFSAVAGG